MSRPGKLGVLFGVIASMTLALAVSCAFMTGHLPIRPFNSAVWQNPPDPERTRVQMVDALLWTHELRGKSRAEVDRLLGRPPATNYFEEWDYVYRLGMERGVFSIDSEWLVLRFGRDDRVSEWAVVHD